MKVHDLSYVSIIHEQKRDSKMHYITAGFYYWVVHYTVLLSSKPANVILQKHTLSPLPLSLFKYDH